MQLSFDTLPKVRLESMNTTHSEEVDILNQLYKAMDAGTIDETVIDTILDELMQHTMGHFSGENEMMQRYGFPAIAMHMGEHQRVLTEMEGVIHAWKSSRELVNLMHYFCEVIPQWLQQHISTMDTVTAQFLAMHVK